MVVPDGIIRILWNIKIIVFFNIDIVDLKIFKIWIIYKKEAVILILINEIV
mgnify:CR=1 FL=1